MEWMIIAILCGSVNVSVVEKVLFLPLILFVEILKAVDVTEILSTNNELLKLHIFGCSPNFIRRQNPRTENAG